MQKALETVQIAAIGAAPESSSLGAAAVDQAGASEIKSVASVALASSDSGALKVESIEQEALEMLKSFSAENKDPSFRWDEHYARGFDVINFNVLKKD